MKALATARVLGHIARCEGWAVRANVKRRELGWSETSLEEPGAFVPSQKLQRVTATRLLAEGFVERTSDYASSASVRKVRLTAAGRQELARALIEMETRAAIACDIAAKAKARGAFDAAKAHQGYAKRWLDEANRLRFPEIR